MSDLYFALLQAAAAPADQEAMQTASMGSFIVTLIMFFVIFYFFAIREPKKREKEQKALQDSLQVGDEVVTIGGIIGFVVSKKDDTVILETGGNKSKIILKISAISKNLTQHDEQEEISKK